MDTFKALVLEKNSENILVANYRDTALNELSAGNVLIEVAYSGVNYKDALTTDERSGVVRSYPQIPGIDLSGKIIKSEDERFTPGQEVLITGYGLGVNHSGGFSEIAQVPADWVVPLPQGMSLKEAMILGTAGLTAALAVNALENNGLKNKPDARILVTGASGGVGSLALGILKKLGYDNLVALSRKKTTASDYFSALSVKEVLTPEEITPEKVRPLMKQDFDFVIDTVGGKQLEIIIPQVSYGGSLALCGNAGGVAFQSTVLPHILRGINILGIDSVNQPYEDRLAIWHRLSTDMTPTNLAQFAQAEISLADLPTVFEQLLDSQMTGRNLVKIK